MLKNNKEVIERISRVCGKHLEYEGDAIEAVFSTAFHAYYFVKPGKATKKFVKKLAQNTIKGIKEGTELSNETGYNITDCAAACLIPRIVKLCGKSFDARWFECQISAIDDDEFDDTLLHRYVERFDAEQTSHIFQLIVHHGYKQNFYMSEDGYRALWAELNSECKKIDINLPEINGDYTTFPMFIFDCLDKTIISKILLKHITKDKDLAGYVARMLYYTEPIDAMEYQDVAMSYVDLFGFRVFD